MLKQYYNIRFHTHVSDCAIDITLKCKTKKYICVYKNSLYLFKIKNSVHGDTNDLKPLKIARVLC